MARGATSSPGTGMGLRGPRAGRSRGAPARAGAGGSGGSGVRLYGSPGSRSPLVNWYLHEVDVAFEVVPPADPSNPHPMGQVPALRDDAGGGDVAVFESGAILAYLGDRYGGLDTPGARADVNKWLVWANATLDPCLFKETPQGRVIGTGVTSPEPQRPLLALEAHLAEGGEGGPFVLGETFSAADCAIVAYLMYVLQFFNEANYAAYPNIAAYAKRCVERDGYRRAFGPQVTEALLQKLEADIAGLSLKQARKQGLFDTLFK